MVMDPVWAAQAIHLKVLNPFSSKSIGFMDMFLNIFLKVFNRCKAVTNFSVNVTIIFE